MAVFNRKKFVKAVSAEILICVIAAAVIGLGLLFKIISGSNLIGNIMLTLLTLFIAGLFLLNSINAITAGNRIGVFSAIMIVVSAFLYVILIWLTELLGSFYGTYIYVVVIVSMVSILLNLIIANYIALGKSLAALQVLFYLSFAYIELVLSFVIFGNLTLIAHWQIFAAAIIVVITLYVVLKVKQKNIAQSKAEQALNGSDEYVTITKAEYEKLKAAEKRLHELESAASVAQAGSETESLE